MSLVETASSADLGGSSKYSNENFEDRSGCLLYTSDAADEGSSVDLGGSSNYSNENFED